MRFFLLIFFLYGIILNLKAQQTFKIVTENTPQLTQIEENITSAYLQRNVRLTLIYPKNISSQLPILFFNDGQDFGALQMEMSISTLLSCQQIIPFFCVGIHANDQRIQEYGTASQVDYKQRGSKAKQHTDFILLELLPFLNKKYSIKTEGNVMAGLSLGGLSAMDIGWNHPEVFEKIGVFSGALWWRQKSEEDGYTDEHDRIIHNIVRNGDYKKNMTFWFEAGTNDENSDRNNNGIIDAIDDTLDLMKELEHKGYHIGSDIIYEEVQGGEHNHHTWAKVLPNFLKWAFGK
ncbi:alpha/beta hydrolase-fold protein [Arcicella sp. LKC2W]|uniref:alpha/beta hydrolase n=1 Tax=Arcicella sp. LKC2W TaxID=2984198 RepID=UPI002B1EBE67|nr:alpha/beta hydrolase-fold protein [Arcicella sp. LKC2W]MEA5458493.1 alpha/beta hydrolase-fold protein [Arcicella sp. LKC2W]